MNQALPVLVDMMMNNDAKMSNTVFQSPVRMMQEQMF